MRTPIRITPRAVGSINGYTALIPVGAYASLEDPEFDRTVTLRQAYRIMVQYILEYHERGESPTGILLSDVSPFPPSHEHAGQTVDPAVLPDFLDAARVVLNGAPESPNAA